MTSRIRNPGIVSAVAMVVFAWALSSDAQEGADEDFAMQIASVFTISGQGTVLTGVVQSGSIAVGDSVCVPLSNGESTFMVVKNMERQGELVERAETGQIVGVLVDMIERQLVDEEASLHTDC